VFVDTAADHVGAINRGGLRITGPIFEDVVRAPACLPDAVEGSFHRVFLCTKALHTAEAVRALEPHLAPDGFVVSAQNGLNELMIAETVGRARTIGCFVNFGADYIEPGVVHYGGRAAVVIGELDGAMTPRVEALHRLLQGFEPRAVLTSNIWGYLWGKLVYGALLFGTALTNDSIADALADPRYRSVLTGLGREVGAVAAAEGVATEGFDGFDPSAFAPNAPAGRTEQSFADMVAHNRRSAKTHSGIWRDLAIRKRKTEAEALLGPIVAAGRSRGVATPLVAAVLAMIGEIERGERQLRSDNLLQLAGELRRGAA
jgi:2-dehydropantoate 2-reductase